MKIKNLEIDRGMRLTWGFCLTSPFLLWLVLVFLMAEMEITEEENTPQRFDFRGRVVYVDIVTDVTLPTDLLLSDRAEGNVLGGKHLFQKN